MKVKSVRKYEVVKYPEKKVVLRNTGILKTIPQRWKGNAKVGIALSSLLFLTLTACDREDISKRQLDLEIIPGHKTAPIFEHGEGLGAYGCVSIAPPVFLSEEEARKVIIEEASRYGIKFENGKNNNEVRTMLEIKNIEVPVTKSFPETSVIDKVISLDNIKKEPQITKNGSLILDGCDKEKKIAFEYVSEDDFRKWNPDFSESPIFYTYDIINTAKAFTESINEKTGDINVGTFYDPMTEYEDELKDEAKRLEVSRKQLKEQVRDFICWLKAQGVI